MLKVGYDPRNRSAVLGWDDVDQGTPWVDLVRRVLQDHTQSLSQTNPLQLVLPWWSFLSARADLAEIVSNYGVEVAAEAEAETLLIRAQQVSNRFSKAEEIVPLEVRDLEATLARAGFTRRPDLKAEQLRNVSRLVSLPAGATFSVPGAGKTAEALATFFYKAQPSDRLLVIAPKNAFGAWEEELATWVPGREHSFTRLRGGQDRIEALLRDDPRFMLITYHALANVRDVIAGHLTQSPSFVFLDESHRIKSGRQGVIAESVLSLSHLPVSKLILSGTPMPQSDEDLIPQFTFLFPEIRPLVPEIVSLMKPFYVRTTKGELDLPPVDRRLTSIALSPAQYRLYNLMRYEVARQAEDFLSRRDRTALRRLGQSVMLLLEAASNPSLLAGRLQFTHPELLAQVLAEGDSPKVSLACRRARELVASGKKVLIWTSFVQNVEIIAARLRDLGAVYIHGGVDAGDEEDDDTREGKIRLFHDEDRVQVLVANPAAASEGISLHKVCHHALYVDRTFNAAHYLQSEDRIHRLGLDKHEKTVIEILEAEGTIDEVVRLRLNAKVDRMARALEDTSLQIDPIPFDPPNIEDPDAFALGLDLEDAQALAAHLKPVP